MLLIRSILFNLVFFGMTVVAMTLALPLLILPVAALRFCARIWAAVVFWLLRAIVGTRIEYRGELAKLQGPALIASKHQSAWDTIVFFVLCRRPAYVMKKELMLIPIYGWLAAKQGHISIDRKAGAGALRRLVRDTKEALADSRSIVVFPQGTRSAPGEKLPYHPGIVGLYEALNMPVIPVALNSGLFWGKRSFFKRPGVIVVEVLPEIAPGMARRAFRQELETRIETATARLEAETHLEAEGRRPI